MRAGMRPWEVDKATLDELIRWVGAHYGAEEPEMTLAQKADEVMRRLRGASR